MVDAMRMQQPPRTRRTSPTSRVSSKVCLSWPRQCSISVGNRRLSFRTCMLVAAAPMPLGWLAAHGCGQTADEAGTKHGQNVDSTSSTRGPADGRE